MEKIEQEVPQTKPQKKVLRKGYIGVGSKHQTCVFKIDIESIYCLKDKLEDLVLILEDAANTFKFIIIVICGGLHRYTKKIKNPEQSDQECLDSALKKETKLFETISQIAEKINKNYSSISSNDLQKEPLQKCTVQRWNYWTSAQNQEYFEKEYQFVLKLYNENNEFRLAVNSVAQSFIAQQKSGKSLLKEFEQIGKQNQAACLYQLEQAAVYLRWSAEGYDFIDCLGPMVKTFTWLKSHYVGDKNLYPGQLEHIQAKVEEIGLNHTSPRKTKKIKINEKKQVSEIFNKNIKFFEYYQTHENTSFEINFSTEKKENISDSFKYQLPLLEFNVMHYNLFIYQMEIKKILDDKNLDEKFKFNFIGELLGNLRQKKIEINGGTQLIKNPN